MASDSKPKKGPTIKQEALAAVIIAGIAIGGLFAVLYGLAELVDIPAREDWWYSIFLGVAIGVMLLGIYGTVKLLSKLWNVEFDMSGFKN